MSTPRHQLEQAIAALEAQRAILGDDVVEAGLAPMRERLALLLQGEVPPEQRKRVTVFFADLVGFTSLAETMDAEELHEQLQALWQQLDEVVLTHGGQIDKHMGDGLLALWGQRQSREDDAEQAIRAGLAMQQLLQADPANPFRLRVGISSGLVLLGPLGTVGEVTVLGETVNVASHLEHAAPPGGILISHDSYRLVRGLFDLEALPPLMVPDKRDPLRVYLVKGITPRAFFLGTRGVEGIETRMVGRDAEMEALQTAYTAHHQAAALRAITVVGEAGLGKSRLLYEFLGWVDTQPKAVRLFKGRAVAETARLPYALLRDLFASRFEIAEHDGAEAARAKFEAGFTGLMESDTEETIRQAHIIGHLLGFNFSASPHLSGLLDDPRHLHQRALSYLIRFFEQVAQGTPLLLVLEDLHWADQATLTVLQALMRHSTPPPLLLLALARPTLFERRPDWGEGEPFHPRLRLAPLTSGTSEALVADILRHVEEVPAALRDLVVARAEGNPFYIEELIRMLIEQGSIVRGELGWTVAAERVAALQVPATLAGVLQARLDSLPAPERELLQRASVVGRIFWDGAVGALRTESSADEDSLQLLAACEREVIFRRDSAPFTDVREYLFKHALLRDVTYEGILKRQRRVYHTRAAHWLAGWAENRTLRLAGLIAEHYAQAGEEATAAPWYLTAARQAQAIYALTEAIGYFEKALAHGSQEERLESLVELGRCEIMQGRWQAAEPHLREVLRLTEAQDDSPRRADACRELGRLRGWMGHYDEAVVLMNQAQQFYEAGTDQRGLQQTLLDMGRLYRQLGNYPQAMETLRHAERLSREKADWKARGDILESLGVACQYGGDLPAAQTAYEESLALRREGGDPRRLTASLSNLGVFHMTLGAYQRAQELFESCRALCEETGEPWATAVTLGNLGTLAYLQSEMPKAHTLLEQSVSQFRVIGASMTMALALALLGAVALSEGRSQDALRCFREGLTIARGRGTEQVKVTLLMGSAALLVLAPTQPTDEEQAARFLAVVEVALTEQGIVLDHEHHPLYHQARAQVALRLTPAQRTESHAAARALTLDQALAEADARLAEAEALPNNE